MPDVPAEELRRMAAAIDGGLEPRVRLDGDLSLEGAQRLHDILEVVAGDLDQRAGIETSWPLLRMIDILERGLPATSGD